MIHDTHGYEPAESALVKPHIPCDRCGSSDANALFSDGHEYCYSCGTVGGERNGTPMAERQDSSDDVGSDIPAGIAGAINSRGLHQDTCEKWGYLQGTHHGKPCQIAQYRDDSTGAVIAAKVRFPGKDFTFAGAARKTSLYGKWLWSSGGRMLTITEGEVDALSVSQAQGNKFPVVSLQFGAPSALKAIEKDYEWVTSFERVNLWFDNDRPGKEAAHIVADALPPGLVHIVKAELKDANEYLKAGRVKEMIDLIWRAEPYRPDGIISGQEITRERLQAAQAIGYAVPYQQLSGKLHGLRKGELTMLTSGSGMGKSTLARELAYYLHQEHELTIGNVYLEEGTEKTAQGYVAIHNNVSLGCLRENPKMLTDEVWDSSLAEVVHQRMFFYDHFGSLESENLLAKLRYLAVGCKCDFIVLDHISLVVSGQTSSSEGERKDIDILMTALRSLIENTGVGVIAIVHLKQPMGMAHEEGARVTLAHLRGSGSLKQLSDNVIAVEGDQQGDNRYRSLLRILKNREFGDLGEADTVEYRPDTGRLLPFMGTKVAVATDLDVPF